MLGRKFRIHDKRNKKNIKKNEQYVKKNFWRKVTRLVGKVPFMNEAIALFYCALDTKTPLQAKAVALGALAYLVLPIDFLPDFLPFFVGFTDDATAIATAYRAIRGQVTEEHMDKAKKMLGNL